MRPILTLIFLVVVSLVLAACGGSEEATPTAAPASPPPPAAAPAQTPTEEPIASSPADTTPSNDEGTQVTIINGDPGGDTKAYAFVPAELTFAVGETVTFTLKAESEIHNFSIDAREVDEDVDGGEEVDVTVTFDEAGTHRFYCLFHEANGMEGTITVQ